MADLRAGRDFVHHVEQHALDDRAQPAGAGLARHRQIGGGVERRRGELERHLVHFEQALVLSHQRIARLGQDRAQRRPVERFDADGHRQAADQLGDQSVVHQVVGVDQPQQFGLAHRGRVLRVACSGEAEAAASADAVADDFGQPAERPAADEQDVARVDLDELLLGMLAPALRRNVDRGALDDLEQRLLHPLARDVARDAGIVARLAGDLIDLVQVDDAALGPLDVEVGRLQEPQQDVLDVFADVTGFGQGGGVADAERHVQDARQRLRQQGLAAAGRSDEQDVALLQLDFGVAAGGDALVVVVDGHRQDTLGVILPDDVLGQLVVDLLRRQGGAGRAGRMTAVAHIPFQDVAAQVDAFVADEYAFRAGDQPLDLGLGAAAEGTASCRKVARFARHRLVWVRPLRRR
ncbi:MAG: hypothetical protein HW404_749 [Anaerolineales bacterium]|nr:hypothetical protein [Anaerolineales bacterium]